MSTKGQRPRHISLGSLVQVAISARVAPSTTAAAPKNFSFSESGAGLLYITISAVATSSKSAPYRYHRGMRERRGGEDGGSPRKSERKPGFEGWSGVGGSRGAPSAPGPLPISAPNFRPITVFGTPSDCRLNGLDTNTK